MRRRIFKILPLVFFSTVILLNGCAGAGGTYYTPSQVETKLTLLESQHNSGTANPKNGEVIWGNLRIGMTIRQVLAAIPDAKFDDQWPSGGIVGVMAEGGILATEKIKVVSIIDGPYKTPSNIYCLFDKNGLLEGIVIATFLSNLPAEVKSLYGSIGFYLPEFKEAAKILIKYGIPELGARRGPPKFGRERLDSVGSVGLATGLGPRSAIGVGFLTPSLSPAVITQTYDREGFHSVIAIRSIFNGLYNVYSAPVVMMHLRAKPIDDSEIPDVE